MQPGVVELLKSTAVVNCTILVGHRLGSVDLDDVNASVGVILLGVGAYCASKLMNSSIHAT